MDDVEELIVGFEGFEGVSGVDLISVLLDIHGIFGLFHDHFPLVIDLGEHGGLFWKVFEGKRRAKNWLQVNPVSLVEVPFVDQILNVSQHFSLGFNSVF